MLQKKQVSFLICIAMDAIGYASYLIPGLAEFSDIVWAPISAYIFYKTFGGKTGAIGAIFNFIEEALPGTDFIPSFTIMWFLRYVFNKKKSQNISVKATS